MPVFNKEKTSFHRDINSKNSKTTILLPHIINSSNLWYQRCLEHNNFARSSHIFFCGKNRHISRRNLAKIPCFKPVKYIGTSSLHIFSHWLNFYISFALHIPPKQAKYHLAKKRVEYQKAPSSERKGRPEKSRVRSYKWAQLSVQKGCKAWVFFFSITKKMQTHIYYHARIHRNTSL